MSNVKKLGGGRMIFSDQRVARLCAYPPAGTTLDDVLHPQYFLNHFNSFKLGCEITVLSEDMSLDVRLRVVSFDRFKADIRVLNVYSEPDTEVSGTSHPSQEDDTSPIQVPEVTWGGPHHKWRVVHNGEVLEHGFGTKEAADAAAERIQA